MNRPMYVALLLVFATLALTAAQTSANGYPAPPYPGSTAVPPTAAPTLPPVTMTPMPPGYTPSPTNLSVVHAQATPGETVCSPDILVLIAIVLLTILVYWRKRR